MSLLICTPMYGGQCTKAYFDSCLRARSGFDLVGFDVDWLTIGNESLIQRARDNCVGEFLEGSWERLLFIDADIGFDVNDVSSLWNLDLDIVAASVPLKKQGVYNAWAGGENISPGSGVVRVDYVGTAFMMIKRGVFEGIDAKPYRSVDGQRKHFFPVGVRDGFLVSEDYGFCDLARDAGYAIHVDGSVKVTHWGFNEYAWNPGVEIAEDRTEVGAADHRGLRGVRVG